MDTIEEQSLNTLEPKFYILFGKEISTNELHPLKASASIA
jgi:hypothetical protein